MTSTAPETHDRQVDRQFGPVAAAYLTSAVHASGEDLAETARRFAGRRNDRVLDLGCGAGHLAFAIAPQVAAVVAYDLSRDMLGVVAASAAGRGMANIETRQGAAEALPFGDASFDAVCTRFSAHHWADVPKALAEVRRVLKPGGPLIVIDIVSPGTPLLDTHLQTVEVLRDTSHVRDYSVAEWRGMLSAAGFVPGAERRWKLRMDFATWTARMRTPPDRAAVIRGLLQGAAGEVRRHFAVEADGSFQIESAMLEAS
jgi:ubiquinone/menaquinone biosynthesis C-methylase UbiE